MLAVGMGDDSLSADFHHEIYPQAEEMLEGRNPYPPPDFDPTVAPNFIWPPFVAYALSPLTLAAGRCRGCRDGPARARVLRARALARRRSRLAGLRGLALWPQVAGEMRVSHLTAPLCLLVALAWRPRDTRSPRASHSGSRPPQSSSSGPSACGSCRGDARWRHWSGACIAAASLLLVMPFTSLDDYLRALSSSVEDSTRTRTRCSLLLQSGASETVGRVAVFAAGALSSARPGATAALRWRLPQR